MSFGETTLHLQCCRKRLTYGKLCVYLVYFFLFSLGGVVMACRFSSRILKIVLCSIYIYCSYFGANLNVKFFYKPYLSHFYGN